MSECDARAYELLRAARDIFEAQDVYGHYSALLCEAEYGGDWHDALSLKKDITKYLQEHGKDVALI